MENIKYEDFDNVQNKEIFYEMYIKELNEGKNKDSNNSEKKINKDEFKQTLEKLKITYTGNSQNYYYNYDIKNISTDVLKNKILIKYIEFYINFFEFNLNYTRYNYMNSKKDFYYGYYSSEEDYGEEFKFYTLNYSVGYFKKNEWKIHYINVKETINFINKNKFKCLQSIENMEEDLEILNEISIEYHKIYLSNNIEKIDNFRSVLDNKYGDIKNKEFGIYTYESITNNKKYIAKTISLTIKEIGRMYDGIKMIESNYNEKIRNIENENKELKKQMENDKFKIIEMMGLFLSIFAFLGVNFNVLPKIIEDSITYEMIKKETEKNGIGINVVYLLVALSLINFILVSCIKIIFKLIKNMKEK